MATHPQQQRRRFAPLFALAPVGPHAPATELGSKDLDLLPVPHEQSIRSAFEREVARSRRYGRPFSILVVLNDMARRQPLRPAAALIADEIRRLDALFLDKNRLIVICPETDEHGVEVLATRLRQAAMERAVNLAVGVASFPAAGTALDGLVSVAQVGATGGFADAHLSDEGWRR